MKRLVLLACSILLSVTALADEGMWMISNIDKALAAKMKERGLALEANEIYNADAPGASLADAVVSLGFYCTGSMISDNGLLITNHHCAYSDIFELSTPGHNYLEDGYWALKDSDEIPIKGKEVFFLKRVVDVTDEYKALAREQEAEGKGAGFRRLSYLLEKKYSGETGLYASVNSMWSGTKYYLSLYQVYTDLRLVAAPPVSIAAFGGDEDNWEWPQHKCDFAMYRVYAAPDGSPAEYSETNVPLHPARTLEISLDGYNPGSFSMVIGYPGRTDRYSSAAEVDYMMNVTLPVANEARLGQMKIMKKWMDADPAIWLKYSDTFFSLSNVGEMQEGEYDCIKRFGVIESKALEERGLQAWKGGSMIADMKSLYSDTEAVEINKAWFRETIVRGTIVTRLMQRLSNTRGNLKGQRRMLAEGLAALDPRVEGELLNLAVKQYYSHVDSSYFGPYQKSLLEQFGSDYDAIADYIWMGSLFSNPDAAETYEGKEMIMEDPLYKFIKDIDIKAFNSRDFNQEKRNEITSLSGEYTRSLYAYRESQGIPQYPDANSTMRISYGTVGSLSPRDGVTCSWRTTIAGLAEKYDASSRDFCYDADFGGHIEAADWKNWAVSGGEDAGKLYVNFLTDNDITGGNSGSPVLNAKGQLIGLAFDGNKESLAGDVYYTPEYNKCVCVDIRYVLYVLDRYAGMRRILDELRL